MGRVGLRFFLSEVGRWDLANGTERRRNSGRERRAIITICRYKSATDPSQRGFFRTLIETGEEVCPVRSMISNLNSFALDCESDCRLFSDDVEKRIRSDIKRSASPSGLNDAHFSTRSLRSGGATALYVRGISLCHIRRFGRRESDTFRRYIYRDYQMSNS